MWKWITLIAAGAATTTLATIEVVKSIKSDDKQ
jgi:hypothetical protein